MKAHIILRDTSTIILIARDDEEFMSVWIDAPAMIITENGDFMILNSADQLAVNATIINDLKELVSQCRTVFRTSYYCVTEVPPSMHSLMLR